MFPITNNDGKTAGFGGRKMDDSQPKYLNSPETPVFDKSSLLYGFSLARGDARKQDVIIIVEGYIDVIISHQNGFKNTVAAMGTAIGEHQLEAIKKVTGNIILAMDADEAGEKAMLRLVDYENTLKNEIKVALIPPGLDPDEVISRSSEEWQQLLDGAEPLLDFSFSVASRDLDLDSAAGKSRLAEILLPNIAQIQNPVRQAHYLQKLSSMIKVDEQRLESSIKKLEERKRQRKYTPSVSIKSNEDKLFSNPREEFCLALLIQYPELWENAHGLKQEYFANSENTEIFSALRTNNGPETARELLDGATLEYYNQLATRTLSSRNLENKLKEIILLLKESYLRRLLQNQEAILASMDLTEEERTALVKQGFDVNQELREVFYEKSRSLDRIKGESATNGSK